MTKLYLFGESDKDHTKVWERHCFKYGLDLEHLGINPKFGAAEGDSWFASNYIWPLDKSFKRNLESSAALVYQHDIGKLPRGITDKKPRFDFNVFYLTQEDLGRPEVQELDNEPWNFGALNCALKETLAYLSKEMVAIYLERDGWFNTNFQTGDPQTYLGKYAILANTKYDNLQVQKAVAQASKKLYHV